MQYTLYDFKYYVVVYFVFVMKFPKLHCCTYLLLYYTVTNFKKSNYFLCFHIVNKIRVKFWRMETLYVPSLDFCYLATIN